MKIKKKSQGFNFSPEGISSWFKSTFDTPGKVIGLIFGVSTLIVVTVGTLILGGNNQQQQVSNDTAARIGSGSMTRTRYLDKELKKIVKTENEKKAKESKDTFVPKIIDEPVAYDRKCGCLSPKMVKFTKEQYKAALAAGLIDKDGNFVVPPGVVSDKVARFMMRTYEQAKNAGLIDKDGNVVTGQISPEMAEMIRQQYMAARKAGIIDENGRLLKKPGTISREEAEFLRKSYEQAKKAGLVDKEGNVISGQISPAMAKMLRQQFQQALKDGLIDKDGNFIVKPGSGVASGGKGVPAEVAKFMVDQYAKLKKAGLIGKDGKLKSGVLASLNPDEVKFIHDRVQALKKAGLLDKDGHLKNGVTLGDFANADPSFYKVSKNEFLADGADPNHIPVFDPADPSSKLIKNLLSTWRVGTESAPKLVEVDFMDKKKKGVGSNNTVLASNASHLTAQGVRNLMNGSKVNFGQDHFNKGHNENLSMGGRTEKGKRLFQTGELMYGIMDSEIKSDEPVPFVRARILDGPYPNAVLIGTMRVPSGQKDLTAVTIHFTKLAIPHGKTININAYAVNPATFRTGIASEVDTHFFERWGSFVVAEALAATGDVLMQANTSVSSTIATGAQNPVVTATPQLSPSQQGWVIAGKVGQQASEIIKQNFNKPNTVWVRSGQEIGVFFVADVYENGVQQSTNGATHSAGATHGLKNNLNNGIIRTLPTGQVNTTIISNGVNTPPGLIPKR
ncbi:MAG: hypothetical protein D6732_18130 [Methanobacteriota archaeon]|nr:MAG: hypothetical protein D6732_18130 [Euryarchaeota archaeon]